MRAALALAAALLAAAPARAAESAWTDSPEDPSAFGVLAALPAGTEIWRLTRLAGIAGIAEEVQARHGADGGQLAYREGRRWRVRRLNEREADVLWAGLSERGAFRLETAEQAGWSAPDSAVGWTISRFRVPKERPTKSSELFAPRRRIADVRRVRAILVWLRRAYGLPRAG